MKTTHFGRAGALVMVFLAGCRREPEREPAVCLPAEQPAKATDVALIAVRTEGDHAKVMVRGVHEPHPGSVSPVPTSGWADVKLDWWPIDSKFQILFVAGRPDMARFIASDCLSGPMARGCQSWSEPYSHTMALKCP